MTIAINVIGGLAVFLYGMKLMSESLQQAAGDQLKNILKKMTKNRVKGVLSGIGITSVVQSSSVTTVLVVGFVNASLLSLRQALSIIMGANIGTTITAWIVALLGFKVKIAAFALPIIAIGMVMLFMKRSILKVWGNVFIGFGFLFLGLKFLKGAIPSATKNPEAFHWLAQYTHMGFMTVLLFVLVGTLLTIIIQSSSATAAITITLTYLGYLPLPAAFGMILGENLGTTITANLAALAGNINAKKAAIAHSMFNILGIIWALALFYPFMHFIGWIVPKADIISPVISHFDIEQLRLQVNTRYNISAFHTSFNIINTLLLIWFIPQIAALVEKIVGLFVNKKKKRGQFDDIKVLKAGSVNAAQLEASALLKYNQMMIKNTMKSFKNVISLIMKKYDAEKAQAVLDKEEELDVYRSKMLMAIKEIQAEGVSGAMATDLFITSDRVNILEQIGDFFAKIAKKVKLIKKENIEINEEEKEFLDKQVNHLNQQYKIIKTNIHSLKDYNVKKQIYNEYEKQHKIFRKMEENTMSEKKKNKEWISYVIFKDIARYLDNISYLLNKIATIDENYS